MNIFRLVWNKITDDEWQTGGSGGLYSIVANLEDEQPSFKLERHVADVIEPLGDFVSLDKAQAVAQTHFAENE